MASEPSVAYALAVGGPSGPWYLSHAASFGNLMRTSSPWSARTWPTVAELELWVDRLPEPAKLQIADRPLLIVPMRITVSAPRQTITLKTVEPADKVAQS